MRDAHELCNCVFRFLYQLKEPLLTNELRKNFEHAVCMIWRLAYQNCALPRCCSTAQRNATRRHG